MSNDRLGVRDTVGAEIVRGACEGAGPLADGMEPKGKFILEHWRNGKCIGEWHFHNLVTNQGKNQMFNTLFKGATQIASWYIGLISSVSYTALAATDDYADIGQTSDHWKEYTGYNDDANSQSSTTRPAWPCGSASANPSPIPARRVRHHGGRHGDGCLHLRRRLCPDEGRPHGWRHSLVRGTLLLGQQQRQRRRPVEADLFRKLLT